MRKKAIAGGIVAELQSAGKAVEVAADQRFPVSWDGRSVWGVTSVNFVATARFGTLVRRRLKLTFMDEIGRIGLRRRHASGFTAENFTGGVSYQYCR